MILGENLLVLLVLAFGAALAVGTTVALVRPQNAPGDGELERPPLARSLAMIAIGTLAAVWALVSLITG